MFTSQNLKIFTLVNISCKTFYLQLEIKFFSFFKYSRYKIFDFFNSTK
jgi:hypothetical protein